MKGCNFVEYTKHILNAPCIAYTDYLYIELRKQNNRKLQRELRQNTPKGGRR